MALNYSVSLRPNPLDKDAAPKAYATSQINGELTLKQLSKRVSSQTTVSRADVVAVLTATVDNLLEALTEGKQVIEDKRIHIALKDNVPGEDLKTIFGTLEFQPVASRAAQAAALRAEKEGKTVADLLKSKNEPEV